MPYINHLFVAFAPDSDSFRVALDDVHEVIALGGSFGHLDISQAVVQLRRRTVHVVDVERWLGSLPAPPQHLIVFEHDRKLHGLPVSRADRGPSRAFRELNLRETVCGDSSF